MPHDPARAPSARLLARARLPSTHTAPSHPRPPCFPPLPSWPRVRPGGPPSTASQNTRKKKMASAASPTASGPTQPRRSASLTALQGAQADESATERVRTSLPSLPSRLPPRPPPRLPPHAFHAPRLPPSAICVLQLFSLLSRARSPAPRPRSSSTPFSSHAQRSAPASRPALARPASSPSRSPERLSHAC